jgi:hypothetical protein
MFGGVSVLPSDSDAADRVLGDTWEATVDEIGPPRVPAETLASFTTAEAVGDYTLEAGLAGSELQAQLQIAL